MTPARNPQRMLFFKAHILPVLLVFLIPGFSAWFFGYAEQTTDQNVLGSLETDVRADSKLSAARQDQIINFYEANPPSRIMASRDPRALRLQPMFEPVSMSYATFRWMKRLAWVCLGTIALTFLIVGLSVWYSFRSHVAQYRALRVGWPVLQVSAAIQVLGQATLAVVLSYWVTALLMNVYVLKLIVIIGMMAVVAVISLWKAIFAKVDDRCQVTGETVSEADAPRLWQHVRAMADRLGTGAPDQIIVGIEPSFFVTEHAVTLAGEVYRGRTLYLSLPMLKVLAVDEADAVLGHELAHFSGEDTLWARKIAPLTGKFALYLQTLSKGLSLVVAQFMFFFWKLYSLSIRRLSRQREFRADQVGADLVSKDAMKRALVKTTCYCEYRAETESSILQQQRVDPGLDLSGRLEGGYPAFLSSFAQSDQAVNERVPHPFDTHPTLHNRLEQLGFEAHAALRDTEIQQPVADSWYGAIGTAAALESRLWTERQRALQAIHDQQLAWRLLPRDEEEKAHVMKHFPHAVFRDKKGREATLDFDRLQIPGWESPIFFKDIVSLKLKDSWGKKRLTIAHRQGERPKPVNTKCYPGLFKGDKGDLLTLFGHYYGRHKTAEAANQQSATEP